MRVQLCFQGIHSRSREFAVLQSVGMTHGSLGRMLNFESAMCSIKSLAFGIPLGLVGSYIIYTATEMPVEYAYALPWIPVALCTAGVFAITWAVMRYSASRLLGGSIVETIRKDAL